MSTEKTFTRRELLDALLSVGDDGDPYKFEPDGIWLDSTRSDWDSLTPQEQEDIAGFDSATAKDHPRNPNRLLVGRPPAPGDMHPLPLLPFPFTCVELLEFEDATGSELRSRLPADDGEALERADQLRQPQDPRREAKPNAADIVRLLIGDLLPEDMQPGDNEDAQTPRPLQRTAAQDEAILAALRKNGYEPTELPKPPQGKPGVKAQIRKELKGKHPLFPVRSTIFEKAWQRLRSQGDIRDAT